MTTIAASSEQTTVLPPNAGPHTSTVSLPTGTSEGDLLVFLWTSPFRAELSDFTAVPSGLTYIRGQGINASVSRPFVHSWYKIAGPSEPSSYSFTHSEDYNLQGSVKASIACFRVTGYDAANPIQTDNGGTHDFGTRNSYTLGGVSVTDPPLLRLCIFSNWNQTTGAELDFNTSGFQVVFSEPTDNSTTGYGSTICGHDTVSADPASDVEAGLIDPSHTGLHAGLFVIVNPGDPPTGVSLTLPAVL